MKFKFSFEVLLEHRRKLEDVARREWGMAQEKVDLAKKELDEYYSQVDLARERVGTLSKTEGNHAGAFVSISEFITGQAIRIERHRLAMRELIEEAEIRRDALLEAAKETKTLIKLKEKRLVEFKLKAKKRELKEVDDLIVTRFKASEDKVG
jgi:flagellar FliJ protein